MWKFVYYNKYTNKWMEMKFMDITGAKWQLWVSEIRAKFSPLPPCYFSQFPLCYEKPKWNCNPLVSGVRSGYKYESRMSTVAYCQRLIWISNSNQQRYFIHNTEDQEFVIELNIRFKLNNYFEITICIVLTGFDIASL